MEENEPKLNCSQNLDLEKELNEFLSTEAEEQFYSRFREYEDDEKTGEVDEEMLELNEKEILRFVENDKNFKRIFLK